MTGRIKQMGIAKAVLIFSIATAYFFLLLITLLPFIKESFALNPAVYWFITGYFLFIPLFIAAIALTRSEGNKSKKDILYSLSLRAMDRSDWKYALVSTLLVFAISGCFFGVSMLLNKYFGVRELNTTPWFMTMSPFEGKDKLLLLVWLPMFMFNIAGEELLWRGYIQTRLSGGYSWVICSALWLLFHLPFGLDLMIMLVPIVIILPYAFHKTRNTWVGIFIHGIYNGPMFVMIALGLMH